MPDLESLEKELGLVFRDKQLLQQALVHSSYLNENPGFTVGSNERLEFLGDALIDLVVGHELYQRFPTIPEGQLTQLRSALVRGETLARTAKSLRLGQYLLMGQGEEDSGGRERHSILADTFEALAGALFLDQGYDATRAFVLKVLAKEMDQLSPGKAAKDSKSLLQELLQTRGLAIPHYEMIQSEGPDHDRRFTVEVLLNGEVMGQGTGRRMAEAEQMAAQQALDALT